MHVGSVPQCLFKKFKNFEKKSIMAAHGEKLEKFFSKNWSTLKWNIFGAQQNCDKCFLDSENRASLEQPSEKIRLDKWSTLQEIRF